MMRESKFKNFCLIVGSTIATLVVVWIVMIGGQAFVIDTGRQIFGK